MPSLCLKRVLRCWWQGLTCLSCSGLVMAASSDSHCMALACSWAAGVKGRDRIQVYKALGVVVADVGTPTSKVGVHEAGPDLYLKLSAWRLDGR